MTKKTQYLIIIIIIIFFPNKIHNSVKLFPFKIHSLAHTSRGLSRLIHGSDLRPSVLLFIPRVDRVWHLVVNWASAAWNEHISSTLYALKLFYFHLKCGRFRCRTPIFGGRGVAKDFCATIWSENQFGETVTIVSVYWHVMNEKFNNLDGF